MTDHPVTPPTNSLRARAPAAAALWHPERNRPLTPDLVTYASSRKAWWQCSVDPRHVWHARISTVAKSTRGCPRCLKGRAAPEKSLLACFPEIAAEWHPTENGELLPADVTWSSHHLISWRCGACAYVWRTSVSHRGARGHGCPACAGRVATPKSSLRALSPALALEWHPTANGELTPDHVVPGSNKRVTWRCARDPSHVWEAKVSTRTRKGCGCPFCSGRVATPETSLAALHPQLAREWHPTKNAPLTAREVRPGAQRKVWWLCSKAVSHEWQAVIASRTSAGSGCPVCARRQVSRVTSLAVLQPWLAREWHPTKNAPLTAHDVVPGTERSVWWRCRKDPTHAWRAQVCSRTRGRGCPMCLGRVATPKTSLRARFPELARQWHRAKNLPLTPDDVTPGSGKRVWWRCPRKRAHVWEAAIGNRTRKHGNGCPMCSGRVATPPKR